ARSVRQCSGDEHEVITSHRQQTRRCVGQWRSPAGYCSANALGVAGRRYRERFCYCSKPTGWRRKPNQVVPRQTAELRLVLKEKRSGRLTRYCILISGNVGVAHPAEGGNLAVRNRKAGDKPVAGINNSIAIDIEETFQPYGFAVRQT